MAGAGYKLFNTGDVLTAQQVNEYLQQQTVMVFANSTARTTALSGVLAEGMMSYLQDQNKVYVYDGSAWVEPGASLPSQTGNSGKYLTTDGTNPSWGTVSAGGMTLLASGSIAASATGIDISSISGSYNDLVLYVRGMSTNTDNEDIGMRFNNDSGSTYYRTWINSSSATVASNGGTSLWIQALNTASAETAGYLVVRIFDYTNTSSVKSCFTQGMARKGTNTLAWGFWDNTSAVNRIQIYVTGSAAFDSGTYALYGVK